MFTKEQRTKIEELIETKATALADLLHANVASETKANAAFDYVRASDELDVYLDGLLGEEPSTAADVDGWIEWRGGVCPVDGETMVVVKFRGESMHKKPTPALIYRWTNEQCYGDIIAYRVVS